MKSFFAFMFVLGVMFASVNAFEFKMHPAQKISNGVRMEHTTVPHTGVNWCGTCVSILDQIIQELIEIIANVGVVGSCETLCNYLPAQLEKVACNLLCVKDGGKAKIVEFKVVPPTGAQGATFDIELVFQVINATGTGEIEILIVPPDALPFGDAVLNEGFEVGTYGVKFSLQAQPSEQEPFSPGTYKVEGAVCYGECGSKHEHSAVLDKGETSFQITG